MCISYFLMALEAASVLCNLVSFNISLIDGTPLPSSDTWWQYYILINFLGTFNIQKNRVLFGLKFNSQVNTIKVMSSRSIFLTILILGRLSPLYS